MKQAMTTSTEKAKCAQCGTWKSCSFRADVFFFGRYGWKICSGCSHVINDARATSAARNAIGH